MTRVSFASGQRLVVICPGQGGSHRLTPCVRVGDRQGSTFQGQRHCPNSSARSSRAVASEAERMLQVRGVDPVEGSDTLSAIG